MCNDYAEFPDFDWCHQVAESADKPFGLVEWLNQFDRDPLTWTNVVAIPISAGEPGYRELWRLWDYTVSSVSAGVVWLIEDEDYDA